MKRRTIYKCRMFAATALAFTLSLGATSILFASAEGETVVGNVNVQQLANPVDGVTPSMTTRTAYISNAVKSGVDTSEWKNPDDFYIEENKRVYTGLQIDLMQTENDIAEVPLNATFKGDFKLEYILNTFFAQGSAIFSVKDLHGKELFHVGRTAYQAMDMSNGIAYFSRNGVYSTRKSFNATGDGDKGDAVKGDDLYTWDNVTYPNPNTYEGEGATVYSDGYKYQHVLPRGLVRIGNAGLYYVQESGNLVFDYDETSDKMYAKVTYAGTPSSYSDKGIVTGYTKEDKVIGVIDCSLAENADVKTAFTTGGYTVSIRKDQTLRKGANDEVPAVVLLDVNGVSLSEGNIPTISTKSTGIYYTGEKTENGKNVIDVCQGDSLGAFHYLTEQKVNNSVTLVNIQGESFTAAETFADKAAGEYEYTVSVGGLTKEYVIRISPTVETLSVIDKADTSYEFTKIKTYKTKYFENPDYATENQGIMIYPGNEKTYDVTLGGVFQGDFDVEYLLGTYAVQGFIQFSVRDLAGNELFHVGRGAYQANDLTGGIAYFYHDGVYTTRQSYKATGDGWSGKIDGVDLADERVDDGYFTWIDDSTPDIPDTNLPNKSNVVTNFPSKYAGVLPHGLVRSGSNFIQTSGHLVFDYDETVQKLYVKVTYMQEPNKIIDSEGNVIGYKTVMLPIGEIDCSNGQNADVKAAFTTQGYTVSICKDSTNRTQTVPLVMLLSINGASFAKERMSIQDCSLVISSKNGYNEMDNVYYMAKNGKFEYSLAYELKYATGWTRSIVAETQGSIQGTLDVTKTGDQSITFISDPLDGNVYKKTVTIRVEDGYKITLDENGGVPMDDLYYSDNAPYVYLPEPVRTTGLGWKFVGWFDSADNKVESITLSMGNAILKAKWLDDVAPVITLQDGLESFVTVEKGSSLNVSKANVKAEDAAWGELAETAIAIYVKAPNATEFVTFDAFTHNAELYGIYQVKYVAKDGSNNQTELIRNIQYIPTLAVMEVETEMQEKGYIGKMITLPKATATCGTTALDVLVSVVVDGELVELTDNTFTPKKAGTYSIVYLAVDEYERTVSKSFEIVVIKDEVAPVITVDFNITKLSVGDALRLPTATATDEVDGELTVSITVRKNGELLTSVPTTVDTVGVYTVEYVAQDSTGNLTNETFEILVGKAAANNGCGGCGGVVNNMTIPVLLAAIVIVTITCVSKRKRNNQ
ncbi:MAG: InlB B-repeat-containing protein [Clostridia bacterium]|nr:InlB B-repeat-containing protein [Clostridia bacterium]